MPEAYVWPPRGFQTFQQQIWLSVYTPILIYKIYHNIRKKYFQIYKSIELPYIK
jgi:hypothetical protein